MRQPVCVGCDGRELLTPNSVTAPLTEPHLNAHKRSPKYLRSTRSFTGGCGVGASPGKQPRRGLQAEGRVSQAQKSGQCGECRGFPPLVPCQPCRATSAPSGAMSHGLVSSQSNTSLCAEESFWCSHPVKARQAWEWLHGVNIHAFCSTWRSHVAVPYCLLTSWGIASKPKKLSKLGQATKTLGWKQPA